MSLEPKTPESEKSEAPESADQWLRAEEKEFLYLVGAAITDWAEIDGTLFNVCAAILKANKRHVAIIYYRTPTLGARLTLVDELMRATLPETVPGGRIDPMTKLWSTLHRDINDALSVRNQLAHSPASPMTEIENEADGAFAITDVWWGSAMSRTEKLRGRGDKKELRIGDVQDHRKVVGHLWIRLRDFEIKLQALPSQ